MKKIWNFILFLVCVFHFAVLFPTHLFPENTTIEKPMVVVIASYNNIKWYRRKSSIDFYPKLLELPRCVC